MNSCEINNITLDDIGPSKIIYIYSPKTNLKAIVVVDNTALGPSIGGVRISKSVTLDEIALLARTMTLKNAIAGLPHGGGKAGIILDPHDAKKYIYIREFARQIKYLSEYIPGPDMGSDEESMAIIYNAIQRAVGLPEKLGGLPLDKLGATGFGLAECAEISCAFAKLDIKKAKVAIHGFGNVGKAAAKFLSEKGAVVVAVADTKGMIHNSNGIDVKKLIDAKDSTGSVINYTNADVKKIEDIFSIDCDILIPAATPDVINKANAKNIKAKLILQGANIPVTKEAEEILYKKGIVSVPDFIANSGGVIMAAMEYAKKTEKEAFEAIADKIKTNTKLILEKSKKEKLIPRNVAEKIAKNRVLKAMQADS